MIKGLTNRLRSKATRFEWNRGKVVSECQHKRLIGVVIPQTENRAYGKVENNTGMIFSDISWISKRWEAHNLPKDMDEAKSHVQGMMATLCSCQGCDYYRAWETSRQRDEKRLKIA